MPGGEDESPHWGVFSAPVKIIETQDVNQVGNSLKEVEREVEQGNYAAGFISYEAAPAFDKAHAVKADSNFPLLWFGIYDNKPEQFLVEEKIIVDLNGFRSQPELTKEEYVAAVKKIEKYILDGDIYQANFTFRSKLTIPEVAPYQLFCSLFLSHPVPYAAYINTGENELVSLSPELFLEKNGQVICSKPMKGTAHRKLSSQEDLKAALDLSLDEKNRAENIMIVDMVRNDFGRICELGSIKTDPIFHVDTYKTVHQMISTVKGRLPKDISLDEIFGATFPAASITGAPKIRAMQIIKDLERSPRKVYTGSIGCLEPHGDFCFNVAIRTLVFLDIGAELGIGSGIVADSDPLDEWQESLLKSTFVSQKMPEFEMLETLLWTKDAGFAYLGEHLERLRNSHIYFKWDWDENMLIQSLEDKIAKFSGNAARVRLLISADGDVNVETYPIEKIGWGKELLKLKISRERTDSQDLFLYHKTTNRQFYNLEFKQAVTEDFDEVLFANEKGEITEGSISNIFILKNACWLTPPVQCGLLPGVWRAAKLAELKAEEQILTIKDLQRADQILLGNSVRGGIKAKLYS